MGRPLPLSNKLKQLRYHSRQLFSTNIAKQDTGSVTFLFVNQEDREIEVTVPIGTTILEAAHKYNVELEGACDGCMACSTCHVIFDEEVYDALPEPEEEELDMLDLAPCLTNTSRLGCQIKLDESHQGIKVRLPKITRNFYVDGHVPAPH
ncbi:adrenodoxin-type ferredoxin [Babesia ovis]|uniref:Adrenodoxin-type ferredoxin n=1 Tax=Babesia ovis TaxID=5869 RepID=A0A9W5TCG2_BABOV|nr:adrenodoxin-type ferredoxin [Babesia ovis]